MKKTLTLALVALSLLSADAFGRNGRCCKPKCDPCPPKTCPKPCKKESWVVDRFGYIEPTCQIPRQEFDQGYSLVKCEVVCHKDPCGGCYYPDQAASTLKDEGYTVVDKDDVQSRVDMAARQHMMSKM
jgi:hypothetical protein